MALGYLSKAISRAAPMTLSKGPPGVRPATRTTSPLAEEDQRLHDMPDLSPPAAPVTPIGEASPGLALAVHEPVDPIGDSPARQPDADRSPLSADPDDPPQTGQTEDPPFDPARVTQTRFPSNKSEATKARPAAASKATIAPAPPDDPPAPTPRDGPAPAASPEAALARAMSKAEAWVRGAETPDHDPQPSPLDNLFAQADPTPAPPPQKITPRRQQQATDIEPILPSRFDMASAPPPPRPTVEIGSIEVEIVPPAPVPKPATATPQRSSPTAKPARTPAAPFGWRQR